MAYRDSSISVLNSLKETAETESKAYFDSFVAAGQADGWIAAAIEYRYPHLNTEERKVMKWFFKEANDNYLDSIRFKY